MRDTRPVAGSLIAPALLALASVVLELPVARAQAPPPATSTTRPPEKPAVPPENRLRHPLDPLCPEEIQLSVATLRDVHKLPESFKFVSVALNEPAKTLVLHPKLGVAIPREARVVLLDRATGTGYEALVDLKARSVPRFEPLPKGVQPPIMMDEFGECEEAARQSPAFREALQETRCRGHEPGDGRRLVGRALRQRAGRGPGQAARPGPAAGSAPTPRDNGYARPIEGLIAVDRPQPQGSRPGRGLRRRAAAARAQVTGRATYVKQPRTDLKPLEVTQPDGPSFTVTGP